MNDETQPEAGQLPAEVEDAEVATPPVELPPADAVDPPVAVQLPVFPDEELPAIDEPYPDQGLPEAPGDPVDPGWTGGVAPDEPPAPVDVDAAATLANIVKAARKRCEKMTAAEAAGTRRGPAGTTLPCQIAAHADSKYDAAEQALAAIVEASEAWIAGYSGGEVAKRHTFAQRVLDGRYSVPKA
jgi:hypothetical protein